MSRSSESVNMIQCIQDYIGKMIGIMGMKALVMDEETTLITAMVYGQSEIITKEVFLVDRLDNRSEGKENYQHLKAVVFLRPIQKNVGAMKKLLQSSKFKEYHIFFSNVCPEEIFRALAEADVHELIRTVQEYYADYYAVTDTVYTLHVKKSRDLTRAQAYWMLDDKEQFNRTVEGLVALLVSLKRNPDIRYSASSDLSKLLAIELNKRISTEKDLFNYPQPDAPLLLLLDRRDDPVTPLLSQWTYQAMIHEIFTIKDNRVDLSKVAGISKSMEKGIVLSPKDDPFYKQSMFLNFGDLGASIKNLVIDYQRKTKTTTKLDTLEDMQRFVDAYPEFKSLSGNVSKHVTLMHELSDTVQKRQLMRVSECEQELACSQDHGKAVRDVMALLEDGRILFDDKVRIVTLYALRYERENNQLGQMRALLRSKAATDEDLSKTQAIDETLKYAGTGQRGGDLFGNKSLFAKITKQVSSGLRGVENIYTQHKPLIFETLTAIAAGKLSNKSFPTLDGLNSATPKTGSSNKYRLVILYFLGGITYEETASIEKFNADNVGQVRVVIGGSTIHNSTSFLDDVIKGGGTVSSSDTGS